MHGVGTEEYEWLKIEMPNWDRLAEKLYSVYCFMKSQENLTSFMGCFAVELCAQAQSNRYIFKEKL